MGLRLESDAAGSRALRAARRTGALGVSGEPAVRYLLARGFTLAVPSPHAHLTP